MSRPRPKEDPPAPAKKAPPTGRGAQYKRVIIFLSSEELPFRQIEFQFLPHLNPASMRQDWNEVFRVRFHVENLPKKPGEDKKDEHVVRYFAKVQESKFN